MELSEDLVVAILDYIRQRSDYGGISFYFSNFPGEHSDQKIAFHLEYCRDQGYVNGRISGDRIMAEISLTSAGLIYLQNQA